VILNECLEMYYADKSFFLNEELNITFYKKLIIAIDKPQKIHSSKLLSRIVARVNRYENWEWFAGIYENVISRQFGIQFSFDISCAHLISAHPFQLFRFRKAQLHLLPK